MQTLQQLREAYRDGDMTHDQYVQRALYLQAKENKEKLQRVLFDIKSACKVLKSAPKETVIEVLVSISRMCDEGLVLIK